MTLPLTERQERLWRFIQSCDRSPTFDEMAKALGDAVRGAGVSRTIEALETKGYVRRKAYRARSVVAIDPNVDLSTVATEDLAAELARRIAA